MTSPPEATALFAALGVAVTIAVAAIAALWRVVEHVGRIDAEQTRARHEFRGEVGRLILQSEDRLTARIERLENASIGFNNRRRLGKLDNED